MRDGSTVAGLLTTAAMARFRVLTVEGREDGDLSWQRVVCHVHREDVSSAAVPLIHTLAALSFDDARPRESSELEYEAVDEWTLSDLAPRLMLEQGTLLFDADYVRGRMMKTRIRVASNGRLTIDTRNRYLMTERWLGMLRGKRSIRLAAEG
jgi:hypothetical protein